MTHVDQYNDPMFKHLVKIVQDHPDVTDLIKTAELDDTKLAAMPDRAFAWAEKRLFPIDSPEQAVLSRLYMEKQAGIPADVVKRCDTALTAYGIDLRLQTKEAAAPSEDQYIFPEAKRFLVQDANDVKLAAMGLQEHAGEMDPFTRAVACLRLTKHAANYGVKLPSAILKMAGVTRSNREALSTWLVAREVAASATGHGTEAEAFRKLAAAAGAVDGDYADTFELAKLVDAIAEMDKTAGLEGLYGRSFPDPVLSVFNTSKIAGETIDVAGAPVDVEVLAQVPAEDYAAILGDDLAGEFIGPDGFDLDNFQIIWPTIPYDLQKAFRAQLGV